MANIPNAVPAKKAAAGKTRAKSASAEIRATGVTNAKAAMRRAAKAALPA
jgi:hypothetical protein